MSDADLIKQAGEALAIEVTLSHILAILARDGALDLDRAHAALVGQLEANLEHAASPEAERVFRQVEAHATSKLDSLFGNAKRVLLEANRAGADDGGADGG